MFFFSVKIDRLENPICQGLEGFPLSLNRLALPCLARSIYSLAACPHVSTALAVGSMTAIILHVCMGTHTHK